MQRFLHRQNLARYVRLLATETDPKQRERIAALLIEELDRFDTLPEHLSELAGVIEQGRAQLRKQRQLVAQLRGDPGAQEKAQHTLINLNDTLELFLSYRDGLRGDGPAPHDAEGES
jgi:hypothetical protein